MAVLDLVAASTRVVSERDMACAQGGEVGSIERSVSLEKPCAQHRHLTLATGISIECEGLRQMLDTGNGICTSQVCIYASPTPSFTLPVFGGVSRALGRPRPLVARIEHPR